MEQMKKRSPFYAVFHTSSRRPGRARSVCRLSQSWLLLIKTSRLVSKCKVSHSYSLKSEMKKNETDLITATQERKEQNRKSPSLIACTVNPMDFYQQDKKVDFVGKCIYHKAWICPAGKEKWPGNCSNAIWDPILQILLFPWQVGQGDFCLACRVCIWEKYSFMKARSSVQARKNKTEWYFGSSI